MSWFEIRYFAALGETDVLVSRSAFRFVFNRGMDIGLTLVG